MIAVISLPKNGFLQDLRPSIRHRCLHLEAVKAAHTKVNKFPQPTALILTALPILKFDCIWSLDLDVLAFPYDLGGL